MRPLLGLLVAASVALAADPIPSTSKPVNPDLARKKLGLVPLYASVPRIGQIKIAILDSGFAGVTERPYLPKSAVVVESYDPEFVTKFNLGDPTYSKPFTPGDAHGRLLAQLVWAVTGGSPDGPKFYLLNANGPTLFRRAVKAAVEAKVDLILFAGTFEGAGNYDGKGPINAAVDEAVAAGILWVNAAGNTGGLVYDGPVSLAADGFLRFGNSPTLRLRNRLDEHAVTVTLTWNDYKQTEDAGTTKDLDLFVEDAAGRVVGQSTLRQVPPGKKAGDGETTNPRERLTIPDLAAGEYHIRVKSVDSAFNATSRLRVLVTPGRTAPYADPATGKPVSPVELLDATHAREIYPPADHPGVLTVGDPSRYSAVGPTADGRAKPDVVLESSVARFTNGEESDGSSNAAAYFAGVLAVLKAHQPGLTADHVREWVKRVDRQLLPGVSDPGYSAVGTAINPRTAEAMRVAGKLADEQLARGIPSPGVYVTSAGRVYRVLPGGGIDTNPAAPSSLPTVRRAPPPHAAWVTPSPAALAALIQGNGRTR